MMCPTIISYLPTPLITINPLSFTGILKEALPDDSGFDNHRMMTTSNLENVSGVTTVKQELDVTSTNNAGDLDSVPTTSGGSSRSPPKSKVQCLAK